MVKFGEAIEKVLPRVPVIGNFVAALAVLVFIASFMRELRVHRCA